MTLVTAEQIAAIMALVPVPQSLAQLDEMVARGLPKGVLKASIERVYQDAEKRKRLLYTIIPEATYKRRRDRLTSEESSRTERLARIIATAEHVWSSAEDAQAFLTTSHTMLGGRTPLEVSLTEIGARRVEDLLWRLYYGISA